VEARVQGDEGEDPGEVENPGEHRALGGLIRYLVATDSRGEKGLEDEPLSLSVALPCFRGASGFGPRADGQGGSGPKTRHRLRSVAHGRCQKDLARPSGAFQTPAPSAHRSPTPRRRKPAGSRATRADPAGSPQGTDAPRTFGSRRSRGRTPGTGDARTFGSGRSRRWRRGEVQDRRSTHRRAATAPGAAARPAPTQAPPPEHDAIL
jgi:hypothetical protein